MTKSRTAKAWHGVLASLPCQLCGISGGTTVHHIREGQGMSQRAGHFLTVALCRDCHQGPMGVHGDKTMLRIHKTDELALLDKTIEAALRQEGKV